MYQYAYVLTQLQQTMSQAIKEAFKEILDKLSDNFYKQSYNGSLAYVKLVQILVTFEYHFM